MAHNPFTRRPWDSSNPLFITKYRPESRAVLLSQNAVTPTLYTTGNTELVDSSNYVFANDFTVGETVTGATSLATAVVVAWEPAAVGFPGSVLLITDIVNRFVDGELVTGSTSFATLTIALDIGIRARNERFVRVDTDSPLLVEFAKDDKIPADPGPGSLRVNIFGIEWLQLGPHSKIKLLAEAPGPATFSLIWASNDPRDD